jgi:hypothetical protein
MELYVKDIDAGLRYETELPENESGHSLPIKGKWGFSPTFTDTLVRLIMGEEGCHGTTAEVFSRVQA